MSLTIGELSETSGVPIATLRDWDRRHGLTPTYRTAGRHRRYSQFDAALVLLVRDLVAGGLRLRAAVPLARDEHKRRTGRSTSPAFAEGEHQRIRESVAASRGATLVRRDELVAERVALVAHRETLIRARPTRAKAVVGADSAVLS